MVGGVCERQQPGLRADFAQLASSRTTTTESPRQGEDARDRRQLVQCTLNSVCDGCGKLDYCDRSTTGARRAGPATQVVVAVRLV